MPIKTKIKQSEVATTKSEIPQLLQGVEGVEFTVTVLPQMGSQPRGKGSSRELQGAILESGETESMWPTCSLFQCRKIPCPDRNMAPYILPKGHTALNKPNMRNSLPPQKRRQARQCQEKNKPCQR